jgi:cellulose biosynthesis protein BcsQ
MYVVTFYSFKGGVGRTMALVNTAFALARREAHNRVLIVDFDLEAPGLTAYKQFATAADTEGLVDYVVHYRETGKVPNVMQYVVQCAAADGSPSLPLYVMPAGKSGKRDKGYRTKLHSIDWPRLYSEHEGYLMFEDMKQQWAGHFDYVLIDSRTGHTDIGGICTRHLPDVVVLMFFPNAENIGGLEVVVDEIRQQAEMNEKRQQSKRLFRRPKLLFCPSNVPVLDDENDILSRQMEHASDVLKYKETGEPVATIWHYESLDLVSQPVFVIDRDKTRLAHDYRRLMEKIVKGNVEDRDGALAIIEEGSRQLRMRRPSARYANVFDPDQFLSEIEEIERRHPDDGEIAFRLASIYRFQGNLLSEQAALTIAIDKGHEVIDARRLRAANLIYQNNPNLREAALDDLRAVVNSDEASPYEIAATFEPLRRMVPEKWIEVVANSTAIRSLPAEHLVPIAEQLMVDEKGARLAAALIRDQWANRKKSRSISRMLESAYVLSLIGSGQVSEAKIVLADSHPGQDVAEWDHVADVFNYAMADWAEKERPPESTLRKVLALDEIKGEPRSGVRPDPNYEQCMALVHAALGNREKCEERLKVARRVLGPGIVFSSWRYLKVNRYDMMKDLQAMERGCQTGKAPQPLFLKRRHELSSVE